MKYLTRQEAADYVTEKGIPYSRATFQKFATTGGGPVYRLCGGRALYKQEDLDAWVDERTSPPRRSTSEGAQVVDGTGEWREEPPRDFEAALAAAFEAGWDARQECFDTSTSDIPFRHWRDTYLDEALGEEENK